MLLGCGIVCIGIGQSPGFKETRYFGWGVIVAGAIIAFLS